jgi:C-terminal processing protease CtpA/Prc
MCVQVGIILRGTAIESTVVGGPAFTSMTLARGDVILEADGKPVTEQTIEGLLTGNDKPGSLVVLTVSKGSDKVSKLYLGA